MLKLACPIVGVVHPNMTINCRHFVSSSINDLGVVQPVFATFSARGQIQPVTASKQANQHDVSVSKKSINVWINAELHTVDTQEVADQVEYAGSTWNIVSVTSWNPGNGWGTYVATLDKRIESPTETISVGESGEVESGETEDEGGLEW